MEKTRVSSNTGDVRGECGCVEADTSFGTAHTFDQQADDLRVSPPSCDMKRSPPAPQQQRQQASAHATKVPPKYAHVHQRAFLEEQTAYVSVTFGSG